MTEQTSRELVKLPSLEKLRDDPHSGAPWCLRCNRVVERWGYEILYDEVNSWQSGVQLIATGEVIFDVSCHGETWKASNVRGVLRCD